MAGPVCVLPLVVALSMGAPRPDCASTDGPQFACWLQDRESGGWSSFGRVDGSPDSLPGTR